MKPISWIAAAVLLLSSVSPAAVVAQEASSFPEFSAKRVKPPKAGATKRINVQIAPRANPAVAPPPVSNAVPVAAATATPKTPAAGDARYAWYWNVVSSGLEDTGPHRLDPALVALRSGPEGAAVSAPRLQDIQDIAARHGTDLLRHSVGTDVSPALALAVMVVESGGRVDAVSSAGAQGLMQLMPATAERFGVSNAMDASDNIKGGIAFLDFLMKKFEGDPILVLAGYNAGENSIGSNDGVPPFVETRDYVPKVLAAYETARGLCRTQPMLLSDGCVFNVSQ